MAHPFDASRSLTALEQDSTIIAVIEMSQAKWLVAAVVPGVERQPLKKLDADEKALLNLLHRWRNEAGQAGRQIKRIVVAYEAGRDVRSIRNTASLSCEKKKGRSAPSAAGCGGHSPSVGRMTTGSRRQHAESSGCSEITSLTSAT